MVPDILALLLNNARTPEEREGDLGAQIAACQTGAQRLGEVCVRYNLERTQKAAADLLDYSEELMRAFLATVPPGEYRAADFLDDDGEDSKPVRIAVTIKVGREPAKRSSVEARPAASHPKSGSDLKSATHQKQAVTIDFTGSDPQVQGAVNAMEAVLFRLLGLLPLPAARRHPVPPG